MISFSKGSFCSRVTYYLCLCGELCWRSLDSVLGGVTRRYALIALKDMEAEGYVRITENGQLKTIRAKKALYPHMEQLGKIYFDYYNNNYKNKLFHAGADKKRTISRHHRVAEALIFFNEKNCAVWPWDKPLLSPDPQKPQSVQFKKSTFYSSKDIKMIDKDIEKKIKFSRSVGILFSDGGNYPVYNLGNAGIKWDLYGEVKIQVLLMQILKINGIENKKDRCDECIIFGYDISLIFKILSFNETVLKNLHSKDMKSFEFFTTQRIYENLYYVPFDEVGSFIYQLLTTKNWRVKLLEILFGPDYQEYKTARYGCDAFINGKFYFNFISFNINALNDFKEAFILKGADSFIVLCLKEQQKYLQEYLGNSVRIRIIEKEKILQLL